MHSTAAIVSAVLVVSLGIAACGGDRQTGSASSESPELECERKGYPCTWAEVDPAVDAASKVVWVRLAARMEISRSPEDVAAFARNIPEVAEVQSGTLAVRFRMAGGRPYWVFLPYDPAFPIEGAAPRGGVRALPAASVHTAAVHTTARTAAVNTLGVLAASLTTPESGEAHMDPVGDAGQGKTALVLSPFEWQFTADGGKAAPVAAAIASIPDYKKEHGGDVVFHANLAEAVTNKLSFTPLGFDKIQGDVTLDDFLHWDQYDYIYLSTHGAEACPRASAGEPCHTVLMAGRASARDLQLADTLRGVDKTGVLPQWHPELTDSEVYQCLEELQVGNMEASSAGGKPCLFDRPLSYEILLLTTEFFRTTYQYGLEDKIVFLAACQSTRAGDLVNHLTGNNQNIAVFGFDEVVRTDQARAMGVRTAELVRERYNIQEIEMTLNKEFKDQPFWGLVQSTSAAGAEPFQPARAKVVARHTTYGRDIIRIVDPTTGDMLEDGASLQLVGEPGDGRPDSVEVILDLGRLDREAMYPELYEVRFAVEDRDAPATVYRLEEQYDEGTLRRTGPVELGFDVRADESMNIEVSATLPGGGETRWTYKDIRLTSEFFWVATVSGGPYAGTYRGTDARAGIRMGKLLRIRMFSEADPPPHVTIMFGGTNDEPLSFGSGLLHGPQGIEVLFAPVANLSIAANEGTLVGFGAGAPSEIERRQNYPPAPTVELRMIGDNVVAGTALGEFYRTTHPQGFGGAFPEQRATIRIEFRAKVFRSP